MGGREFSGLEDYGGSGVPNFKVYLNPLPFRLKVWHRNIDWFLFYVHIINY